MAHQGHESMVWERNGPFTDTAKMTEGTNPHNGIVQLQISDLSIQENGRVTILLQKELINHEATEGYLTRNITTRF